MFLLGQKEAKEAYFPHAPTPAQSNLFMLILIGLLALMFLCSCIIAFFYIRLRVTICLSLFLSLYIIVSICLVFLV